MKTNIVGIIIALILTFVGMLSVYAQDTKVSEVLQSGCLFVH